MDKIGYIYIMTNQSFSGHDWVKIGYSDNVELRRKQLSTTGLPFDYEIYATYELPEGVKIADKALHKLIQKLNPNLRLNRNREFFEISPKDAYEILLAIATINGREEKVVLYENNKPLFKIETSEVENEQNLISPQNACGMTCSNEQLKSDFDNKLKGTIFYLRKAKMVLEGKKCKVLAGSRLKSETSASFRARKANVDMRERLQNEGFVENELFVKDFLFESSSAAACQICGNSTSGPNEWKTEKGVKLAEFLKGSKND